VTGRFASLTASRREELNARFARLGRGVDGVAFLAFLRNVAAPILDDWEGDDADAVLSALFEFGIAGLRSGVLGARAPAPLEEVLVRHRAAIRPHLAADPKLLLRALGNGTERVARELGSESAARWLELVASRASACPDRAALLDLGLVVAWTLGLSEARERALERSSKLSPALRVELLGGADLDLSWERRFAPPGARAELGPLWLLGWTGGFVGFGGPFRRPPRVCVVADRVVCTDYESTYELCADVYGSRLRAAAWAHEAACAGGDSGGADLDRPGSVRWGSLELSHPELRGATSAAAARGLVGVTLADSHRVFVVGRWGKQA
jgi:hypothetical protein